MKKYITPLNWLLVVAFVVLTAGCEPPETATDFIWDESNWDEADWG